jgi:hypothetical protein
MMNYVKYITPVDYKTDYGNNDPYTNAKSAQAFFSSKNIQLIVDKVRDIFKTKHGVNIGDQTPAYVVNTLREVYTDYLWEQSHKMYHTTMSNVNIDMFEEGEYNNKKDNPYYGMFNGAKEKEDDEIREILKKSVPMYENLSPLEVLDRLNQRGIKRVYDVVKVNVDQYLQYWKDYNYNPLIQSMPYCKKETEPDTETAHRRKASGFNAYLFE